MDKFLVNMAIVKVNWDQSQHDILDNYIPLVAHTLSQHSTDTISLEEFKLKFREISEFEIPTGALISLLKRSAKKYGLIEKQKDGTYAISKATTLNTTYTQVRDEESRRYNELKFKFINFCKEQLNHSVDENEVDKYFFETLYEIAPLLFKHVNDIEKIDRASLTINTYLISKFIRFAVKSDQTSFEAILNFVRGAMLTETFYYSQPDDVAKKFRDITVYFDTIFLIRALGFSDDVYIEPCRELIVMLQTMNVRMRVFSQTYDELYGILMAAATQLRNHRMLTPRRPGDVFDYFNRINATTSDIELEMAKLTDSLEKLGIKIAEKPPYVEQLGINEQALDTLLQESLPTQTEKSRKHDIDCLGSIHRLRNGRSQDYLESCKAIFITTNTALFQTSQEFFTAEYGRSDIPVCMGDQVFTTLVWLKAVKKTPDLPKEQLVASCFAATLPSEAQWASYVREAEKLESKGNIDEQDLTVLIHSLYAREKLMDLTLADGEIIQGTINDVLDAAKSAYTEDIRNDLSETRRILQRTQQRLRSIELATEQSVSKVTYFLLLTILVAALIYGLISEKPEQLAFSIEFIRQNYAFVAYSTVTILSLLFGFKIHAVCRKAAIATGIFARRFVSKILSPS